MGGLTIDIDFIRCTLNPMLAVMHDSRGVNEVNYVWIVRAGGKPQGEKVFVEAHGLRMKRTCMNSALCAVVSGVLVLRSHQLSQPPTEAVPGPRDALGNKIVGSVHSMTITKDNESKRSLNTIATWSQLQLNLIPSINPIHPHPLRSGPPTIR